eukprot:scaffold96602_cov75-Phaeocystis_antarctica.AAC.1
MTVRELGQKGGGRGTARLKVLSECHHRARVCRLARHGLVDGLVLDGARCISLEAEAGVGGVQIGVGAPAKGSPLLCAPRLRLAQQAQCGGHRRGARVPPHARGLA